MIGPALALLLAFAPQGKAPEGAGTVWLAGPDTAPPASQRAALLLVAAPPASPAPLDARAWGGDTGSEVVDVRAALGDPDVAVLQRVREAKRLLLGPGDAREWRDALWDGPRPSALARALREAWGRGAEVTARGSGALLLGGAWLDVEEDANGKRETVARPGLGLLPGVTFDGAARGVDPGPLALRLVARDLRVGMWLPAGGGVRWEPDGGRCVGFGDVPALALDARGARFDTDSARRVLLEWITPERVGLARDPARLEEPTMPPRVDIVVPARLWEPDLWRQPLADGAAALWRTPTGRHVQFVGLPAPDGLAPAAWLELAP